MMAYQSKVGVPLVQAIEAIGNHCEDPMFREVVQGLKQQLESGLQLYEAMNKYHLTFTSEFVGIVRAGELSANLPGAFVELKRYLA
jgi:type II secretory pathway component PulF